MLSRAPVSRCGDGSGTGDGRPDINDFFKGDRLPGRSFKGLSGKS